MSATPPPLPQPPIISEPPPLPPRKTLFHHAATGCLLAPLIVFVANVLLRLMQEEARKSGLNLERAASLAPVIFASISVVGLILGVVALCGIRRYGADKIQRKTKWGMALCALFLMHDAEAYRRIRSLQTVETQVSFGESQLRDFAFGISEYKRLPDGSQIMTAVATNQNSRIGFEIVIDGAWQSQSLPGGLPIMFHRGAVTFRSIGPESDAFVLALDELYGTKIHPKAMVKEMRYPAVSLEGDPRDLSKGVAKIKAFYEPGKEDDDAEFYINFDLSNRKLTIREKDSEFRSQVVKSLQAH